MSHAATELDARINALPRWAQKHIAALEEEASRLKDIIREREKTIAATGPSGDGPHRVFVDGYDASNGIAVPKDFRAIFDVSPKPIKGRTWSDGGMVSVHLVRDGVLSISGHVQIQVHPRSGNLVYVTADDNAV